MPAKVEELAEKLARELGASKESILEQGLRTFLEKKLREIKVEIFQIATRYHVASAVEMERQYRNGTLEEAESWRDLQRLDHLEYKRDQLSHLLEGMG
ncbi:hypothetical protein KAX17_12840 [Candidatus Bipolaricaulota bacterium]|nr:hypothetical protein [Candidatus Bipolaricaulota bacterium]MCK4598457.1 hypothetical protein [Candidatus Bipolaricaulota bacterium]